MLKTILTGALALAVALPAAAQTETRLVRYDDLNLANPAGMTQLERRISAAARAVCHVSDARMGGPGEAIKASQCIAKAKASAKRQVAALDRKTTLGG